MRNLRNQVQIIGRVGNDLSVESTKGKAKYTRVSIAYKDIYKDSNGETIVNTHWFTGVAWGPLAERIAQNVTKGDEILLTAKLQSNQFTTKEGEKRTTYDLLIDQFMITKKYDVTKAVEAA